MAATAAPPPPSPPSSFNQPPKESEGEYPVTMAEVELSVPTIVKGLYAPYLGVSFAVFLSLLPESALSLLPTLKCRNNYLSVRLRQAEEQLAQLQSRRHEDSKANARVVEIFASHRNAWQKEERRLLQRIDESGEEIERLRARVLELEREEDGLMGEIEELKRELGERDELLNFMSRRTVSSMEEAEEMEVNGGGGEGGGGEYSNGRAEECRAFEGEGGESIVGGGGGTVRDVGEDIGLMFGRNNWGFDPNFLSSVAAKLWAERANPWQDLQYESRESVYNMKHFVARRESPWKADGDSTGVPSKLKLLEQELSNLETVGRDEYSLVASSSIKKQAKRYQDLTGKIDDLCRRMQAGEPCQSTLSSEFRTQRQTEFLLEAMRLQQLSAEAGQKLTVLQSEIGSYCMGGEGVGSVAKLHTRRSVDSIKSNLREIQRNLEIWLARIIGDLEGILARDGASPVREYYDSRCGYV